MSEHNVPISFEHPPRGFQFRLSHLFGLTTLAAFAASAAIHFGPGTLICAGGMILAWANWCGAFRAVQRGRRQAIVLWLAWGMFLVSLALPSMHVFNDVYGWGAAWVVFAMPAEALRRGELQIPQMLWFASMDVANLLTICLPVMIWRLSIGRGEVASAVLCVVMIGPWLAGFNLDMLVGFYVWAASFFVALIALPVRSWTLAGMATAALVVAPLCFYFFDKFG